MHSEATSTKRLLMARYSSQLAVPTAELQQDQQLTRMEPTASRILLETAKMATAKDHHFDHHLDRILKDNEYNF
jgi:hypothetical protein